MERLSSRVHNMTLRLSMRWLTMIHMKMSNRAQRTVLSSDLYIVLVQTMYMYVCMLPVSCYFVHNLEVKVNQCIF